ncbi:glycosyltransferase family 39 protein [Sphingomonas montanisoli]|uniref:Uncharacterized protein n=1 Tax=Sphingomonas montanisoli TaxID=2606412 RepID=A0A5D9BZH4_9SPHN|nr:glycosyltransferase family 39 protein [Sphingomonas montanisoli]TZG24130.1 hypothetical protein FYJ91_20055 [Sphingomonas montanisoli]
MRDSAAAIRNGRIALIVILLVAAGLRFGSIDYALSFDEIASMVFARQPLSSLWSGWMVRETNPPLFYTLLHGWIHIFGSSDIAVKALPAVIGLATIIVGYGAGRRLGGVWAGLSVATLMAVSPEHILMSQLARAYILAALGVLIAVHGLIDLVRTRDMPVWPALARYAIGALIALYSHTMLVLFVMLANIAVLGVIAIRWDRKRGLPGPWIVTNAIVVLLWSWWGWITWQQLGGGGSNITWMTAPPLSDVYWDIRETWVPVDYGIAGRVAVLVILASLGYALWQGRRRGRIVLLLAGALAVPAILYAISLKVPVYSPRAIFWPGMLLTLGLGIAIAGLPNPRWRLSALVVLITASIVQHLAWLPDREAERFDDLAVALRAHPERPVLVHDESVALAIDYYCGASCPLTIVAVDPTAQRDWFRGLSGVRNILPAQATAFVADRPFATVRRDNKDVEPLFARDPRWIATRSRFGIGLYLAEWARR